MGKELDAARAQILAVLSFFELAVDTFTNDCAATSPATWRSYCGVVVPMPIRPVESMKNIGEVVAV